MAFPDNLYISDPTEGRVYVVNNDVVEKSFQVHNDVYGFLVAQNMLDFYTVNRGNNSISWYKQLQCIGDIAVGSMPWGICEDPSGRIYVTNYGDNTVSIIVNGEVVNTVAVDKGPRGIVSDANGMIYVACYLSNTMIKMMNNVIIDRIKLPYNPEGITASPNGTIWVTCATSNVVVGFNPKNNSKITLDVGKCPVAVVCDKKGFVYVANFEDDTVTMISTVAHNQATTIQVGDGPTAISIDSKGFVYVTSNLSGEKIYKINTTTGAVIDTIEVCKSQNAFGDFTGCATYNCFHPDSNSGSSGGNIETGAVYNVVMSLKPTFTVTSMAEDENGNYVIGIGSDLFDLSKFNHFTLNECQVANEDGTYTIEADKLGASLNLTGFFDNTLSDPVTFASIPTGSIFPITVGIFDDAYENFTSLKSITVDFNNKNEVASLVTKQLNDGHMAIVIPTRVFDLVRDGIMVQGMQNIADSWDISNLEEADQAKVQTAVAAAINGTNTILVNSLLTDSLEKWLFQIFKTTD